MCTSTAPMCDAILDDTVREVELCKFYAYSRLSFIVRDKVRNRVRVQVTIRVRDGFRLGILCVSK